MKEKILARYLKGWVTDDHLARYAALGVLTAADVKEIKAAKNPK